MTDREYKYLGDFSACEPWAARHMECHDCKVSWTGCWDNFQCPKCLEGELPTWQEASYAGPQLAKEK